MIDEYVLPWQEVNLIPKVYVQKTDHSGDYSTKLKFKIKRKSTLSSESSKKAKDVQSKQFLQYN